MAFNTGNPIGSTSPRDLSDNAENFDRFANGNEAAYDDRLGVSRKSISGMESEFASDQASRATTFANFLASSGYVGTGTGGAIEDYAGGIEITEYNQLIRESGEFYRAKASLSLPYTTTGTWVGDDETRFVSVGDAALRQEIGSGIFRADSLANLESTPGRFDGDAARLVSGTGRDGDFRWNASNLSATLVLASATSDSVDDTTDTINDADHPFSDGDGVITQTTVNGLTAQTVYWVVNSTSGTYQLSATVGGGAIDLTGTTNVTIDKLLDPLQGIYVTPTADKTGASGAWKRSYSKARSGMFGADTDATDNYAALTVGMRLVHDSGGGDFELDLGEFVVSKTVVQPKNVRVTGQGRTSSIIKAASGFTDPYVWQGETDDISFSAPLIDVGINANDQSCIPYYSDRVNELGGLERVFITRFTGTGVKVVHAGSLQAQNYFLKDLEILISDQSTGTAVGLDITGNGADTRGADGITVNRIGNTSNGDTAIMADGLRGGFLSRLNLEGVEDGLVLGSRSTCIGFGVSGVNGNSNVTNLIKISSAFEVDGYTITGVASSGATNAIVDEPRGITITRNRVGLYASGENDYLLTDQREIQNSLNRVAAKDSLSVGQTPGGINRANVVKTGVSASGGVAYITVEVESTSGGSINISGKCIVACTLNVRHHEELQFGFALQTDGNIAGLVTGTQVGTSGGLVDIGNPVALASPTPNFFRIPITNNTANSTVFSISVDISIQGGGVVGAT